MGDYSVITLKSAVTLKSGLVETISGWGKIGGRNPVLPVNLQITDVPLMADSDCAAAWGSFRITPQSQCVGLGGTGSCNGDSGGPLWQEVNGVKYLIVTPHGDQVPVMPMSTQPSTPRTLLSSHGSKLNFNLLKYFFKQFEILKKNAIN